MIWLKSNSKEYHCIVAMCSQYILQAFIASTVFKLQTLCEYRPMHMVPQMPCVVNSSLVVDKQGETEKGSQMPTVFAHWKSIG